MHSMKIPLDVLGVQVAMKIVLGVQVAKSQYIELQSAICPCTWW